MKITIIGAGNMGGAFARGLVSNFNRRELELILSDHEDKHAAFKDLEVKMTSDNSSAVASADAVILAVKPFDMEKICHEISPFLSIKKLGRSKPAEPDFSLPARSLRSQLSPETVIISIAAGVKIGKIAAALENSGSASGANHAFFHPFSIVRVMPNLPATIGESMSGWACSPSVSPEQKNTVRKILQSIGAEIEVEREDDIDRVTAMSGSGPAYVWKFMESMISAGVKIGLSHEQSRALTSQTFLGAVKMADSTPEDVSALRQRVTSKSGTTERALEVFEKNSFDSIMENAVKAAYERAKELGKS